MPAGHAPEGIAARWLVVPLRNDRRAVSVRILPRGGQFKILSWMVCRNFLTGEPGYRRP